MPWPRKTERNSPEKSESTTPRVRRAMPLTCLSSSGGTDTRVVSRWSLVVGEPTAQNWSLLQPTDDGNSAAGRSISNARLQVSRGLEEIARGDQCHLRSHPRLPSRGAFRPANTDA